MIATSKLSTKEVQSIRLLETMYGFMYMGGSCVTEEDGKRTHYVRIDIRGRASCGNNLFKRLEEILGTHVVCEMLN